MLVLSELSLISAKAILHMPRGINSDGLDAMMGREARDVMRRVERRQSTSGSLPSSTGDMNSTISAACVDTLSKITTISNEAGMSACYNILQSDVSSGTFQADLRLYQTQQPSGQFAGVAAGQMLVKLVYPPSTSFNLLMKRSLTKRQSRSMTELQQYSLQGTFTKGMDISKLNNTELMSLMVPMIKINAVEPNTQKPISTNVTTTDTAFFVVGDFQNQFSTAITNPTFQAAAIASSSAFVLPGTTFGIFPTGMIVTCSWMVLFIIACGVGTIGRIQHRSAYRKRKVAMGGRTGKRI